MSRDIEAAIRLGKSLVQLEEPPDYETNDLTVYELCYLRDICRKDPVDGIYEAILKAFYLGCAVGYQAK